APPYAHTLSLHDALPIYPSKTTAHRLIRPGRIVRLCDADVVHLSFPTTLPSRDDHLVAHCSQPVGRHSIRWIVVRTTPGDTSQRRGILRSEERRVGKECR